MNQRKAKQLRKILLKKTSAVLLLVREHYGENTGHVESPQGLWRMFKKLYKDGKVPNSIYATDDVPENLLKLQKESE